MFVVKDLLKVRTDGQPQEDLKFLLWATSNRVYGFGRDNSGIKGHDVIRYLYSEYLSYVNAYVIGIGVDHNIT